MEGLIGPMVIKCLSEKKEISNESLLVKCFDCFKSQMGFKQLKTNEIKDFLGNTLNFSIYNRKSLDSSSALLLMEKLAIDMIISKGLSLDQRIKLEDVRKILKESISLSHQKYSDSVVGSLETTP